MIKRNTCSLCEVESDYHLASKKYDYINQECHHCICESCLKDYLQQETKNKKIKTTLKCPVDKCQQNIYINELLKILQFPNNCKKCNKQQSYVCAHCQVRELEEIAKTNFYSKQLKFDQLVNLDNQKEAQDFIIEHELICPVCREFNQVPMIICPQGHEICRDCYFNIRTLNDVNKNCPLCKTSLLPIPCQSLRAMGLIKQIKINCPSCNQAIKYSDYIQKHFRNCCETKIECQSCHEQVELQFFDIHMANFCLQTQCAFRCDRKLGDHQINFITEHLMNAMKQSDVAHTSMLRLQVVEKFLFYGSFGICDNCNEAHAWQVEREGQNLTFCFNCFQIF